MSAPVRAAVAVVLALALVGPAVAAPPPPIEARTYEVRHRPLAEALELVATILSEDGTVAMRPQLRRLVVRDRPAVLAQVATLLASFDQPPRNVEVTFTLLLGSDARDAEAGRQSRPETFSRDVRGVTETLRDFTKWTSYESLGSGSVVGAEGSTATAVLSDEYRVVFQVDSVDEATGRIGFRSVTLQRTSRAPDGSQRHQNVHSTTMSATDGKMMILGAARTPESRQALFLAMQAKAR